ncbi:MAG: hypothetical protein LBC53_08715 [Spirochaetaceae bacterium]|nr:hypothetical protein [Spirochaetaceae bacterium]
MNGKPLAGKGCYSAGIACNLRSASGAVKVAGVSKDVHPFITQNAPDYDPAFGGEKDAPWQYIKNMRDGSQAFFKYFSVENASGINVEIKGDARGELECGFIRKGESAAAASVAIPVFCAGGWLIVSAKIAVPDGVYGLSFTYKGTGAVDFKSFTLV